MVLENETGEPGTDLFRCDSCPQEIEGRTWTWLERQVSNHTRANKGHRMFMVLDGEA
ncbi:hypothetical protein QEX66_gp24 [Arthrobacter phage Corgi]|uniref:Uncharacterized protein n=1 Tax=Arthrobacter phage Corgi TaxID=2419952 RepID=A0A3G2KF07_9CAUD|nr:hypothetical protein QEX66_gp24 [Arthrobacter phage Corgi]AYN57572.1 hypothetical protein PBI_CORGI_24 [Arthrobacter phage Corgi]